MFGLGSLGNLGATGGAGSFPIAGTAVDADFANNQYSGDTLANILSNSNASGGYAQDQQGTWHLFGANTLRRTNKGILIEESRTNLITNNSNTGAVVGSPGTLPTGWSDWAVGQSGANTLAVVGKGTESGIDYVDLQWSGTATGSYPNNAAGVIFTPFVAATPGQAVAASCFVRLVGGDWTNINGIKFLSDEFNSGGSYLTTDANPWNANLAAGNLGSGRAFGRWTTQNASCAKITLYFNAFFNGAGAFNYTLRFGWPQLEVGNVYSTSPIRTSSVAVTRSADVITIGGAAKTAINAGTGTVAVTTGGGNSNGVAANIVDSNGTALLGFTSSDTLTDAVSASLTTANFANRWWANDYSALAWNPSGRTLSLNGQTVATDAQAQTPSATQHLGSTGAASFLNAYVSRLSIWSSALANPAVNFPLVKPTIAVNLSGQEFAPGSTAYSFPTAGDWSYLAGKGVSLVRLPIAWENLMSTPNAGSLASAYLASIKTALASAAAKGIGVIVDLHNFACYADNTVWNSSVTYAGNGGTTGSHVFAIGSGSLPLADFTNVWSLLSAALAGLPGLYAYETMNEPSSSISPANWLTYGNAAITAIRANDAVTPIIMQPVNNVNGGGFAGNDWRPQPFTGTGIVYDTHDYFDSSQNTTNGGNFTERFAQYGTDVFSAVEAVYPVISWAKQSGINLVVGEGAVDGPARATSCTISGTVLTVGGSISGIFDIGKTIAGAGVTANSQITSLGTGTGGAGTYNLSQSSTVSSGETITAQLNTSSNWYTMLLKLLALLAQNGVPFFMWEYAANNAQSVETNNLNPIGGVDDIRLTAMNQKY